MTQETVYMRGLRGEEDHVSYEALPGTERYAECPLCHDAIVRAVLHEKCESCGAVVTRVCMKFNDGKEVV